MSQPVLRAEALARRFGAVAAVDGFTLELAPAESVAIVGPSGCGKTTLLHMLGLLDRPSAGRVLLGGLDGWAQDAGGRARLRREQIGFVFQQSSLLGHLTALENVTLPPWRRGGDRRAALAEAAGWLERLGLAARAQHKAAQLSGGEAQRVAIARALVNRPQVVLADEPTGSLDSQAAEQVIEALVGACAGSTALLVVTHDRELATRMSRQLAMRDGRLLAES